MNESVAIPESRPAAAKVWLPLIALAVSFALVECVLWGGWGLGFLVAVILTEAGLLLYLALPERLAGVPGPAVRQTAGGSAAQNRGLLALLAAAILLLGACFFLFDTIWLRLLNFPAVLVLFTVQLLLAGRAAGRDWNHWLFWLEVGLAGLIRPLVCLGDFGRCMARLFNRRRHPAENAENPENSGSRPILFILLGLLLALPVLLLLGALLSAADPVFGHLFQNLRDFLAGWSLDQLLGKLLLTVLLLPFLFSFLHSGRSGWRLPLAGGLRPDAGAVRKTGLAVNRTMLITFLSCVNLLYLVFAIIQLTYLTGAFRAELPAGLTYAEYARSGFFELSFVCLINLALILLAVRSGSRKGPAGLAIRLESLLLIAGSFVQWASAIYRMRLYIATFGLTLLRFYVTAFMLLLAVLFLLLLAREFLSSLPLFKLMAAAALLALLVLNFSNADARIAEYNVNRYLSGQLPAARADAVSTRSDSEGRIEPEAVDADYFRELSMSAVPAMLDLLDNGDQSVAGEIAGQLLERQDQLTGAENGGRWQNLTVSRLRAGRLLAGRLEELRRLNPQTAARLDEQKASQISD